VGTRNLFLFANSLIRFGMQSLEAMELNQIEKRKAEYDKAHAATHDKAHAATHDKAHAVTSHETKAPEVKVHDSGHH
jgi:hypothetical protein